MIVLPLILGLAVCIALLQGVGGALEKKGVGELAMKLGDESLATKSFFARLPSIALAVLTTPIFVAGLVMVTILGGGLFMFALSLGDGAKVGLFVAALASVCYLVANVVINHEQLKPLHYAGLACGMAGAVCIALAGFRG